MPQPRLPDFLIVGAAKAGTTTLYSYLCKHPSVVMSEPKEPEFFSRGDVWARGFDWYKKLFRAADGDTLAGEASTTYTRWPHTEDAAARIAEHLPDAKLVYILRHPVERTFSHYGHHVSRFGLDKTFEQAMADDAIYVDCSLYLMQMQRYLDRGIRREQFHVVTLDDLKRDPKAVMNGVQAHLGLDLIDLTAGGAEKANERSSRPFVHGRLRGVVGRIPGALALAELTPTPLKQAGYWIIEKSPFGRKVKAKTTPQPMRAETRQLLLDRFREPNAELASFLGRDLSMWDQ